MFLSLVLRSPFRGISNANRLIIRGLPWDYGKAELKHYFERFGDVRNTRVVYDYETGFNKGIGFVEFQTEASTRAATSHKVHLMDDMQVIVQHEDETPEMPNLNGNRKATMFGYRSNGRIRQQQTNSRISSIRNDASAGPKTIAEAADLATSAAMKKAIRLQQVDRQQETVSAKHGEEDASRIDDRGVDLLFDVEQFLIDNGPESKDDDNADPSSGR